MLKRSGYVEKLRNGVEIGYVAPYSEVVEHGQEAKPITGTQVVHVREYTRRDGAVVQAHDVTYTNKRLIGFRPKLSKFERGPMIFRVLSEEPKREGQHFLGRAFQEEIKKLPEDLEFYLKQLEHGSA